jgi:hypothetical protein
MSVTLCLIIESIVLLLIDCFAPWICIVVLVIWLSVWTQWQRMMVVRNGASSRPLVRPRCHKWRKWAGIPGTVEERRLEGMWSNTYWMPSLKMYFLHTEEHIGVNSIDNKVISTTISHEEGFTNDWLYWKKTRLVPEVLLKYDRS